MNTFTKKYILMPIISLALATIFSSLFSISYAVDIPSGSTPTTGSAPATGATGTPTPSTNPSIGATPATPPIPTTPTTFSEAQQAAKQELAYFCGMNPKAYACLTPNFKNAYVDSIVQLKMLDPKDPDYIIKQYALMNNVFVVGQQPAAGVDLNKKFQTIANSSWSFLCQNNPTITCNDPVAKQKYIQISVDLGITSINRIYGTTMTTGGTIPTTGGTTTTKTKNKNAKAKPKTKTAGTASTTGGTTTTKTKNKNAKAKPKTKTAGTASTTGGTTLTKTKNKNAKAKPKTKTAGTASTTGGTTTTKTKNKNAKAKPKTQITGTTKTQNTGTSKVADAIKPKTTGVTTKAAATPKPASTSQNIEASKPKANPPAKNLKQGKK